jgi:hypothetical protein
MMASSITPNMPAASSKLSTPLPARALFVGPSIFLASGLFGRTPKSPPLVSAIMRRRVAAMTPTTTIRV